DSAIGTGGQGRRARGAGTCTGTRCRKIAGSRKGADRQSGGRAEERRVGKECAGGRERLVNEGETGGSQSHGGSRAVSVERKRLQAAACIGGQRQRSGPGSRGRGRNGDVDSAIGTGGQGRRAREAGTCTGTRCCKITGSRKGVDRQSGG